MLRSDLVGFHTYDYARHFLSSCARCLNLPTTPNGVDYDGKMVTIAAFPIGINPEKLYQGLKDDNILKRVKELEHSYSGKRVVIGVDRLDYIKGVPQRLHAFEIFLRNYPAWRGSVVLIQVTVPSRGDVEEYQALKSACEELAGRVNGKYGSISYTPIVYLHQSVDFRELMSLYVIADVCLITSTRDGMNLVAMEYIAAQAERKGSLILSEFAGAAQSLSGALIANPWNTEFVAELLNKALNMNISERVMNHDRMIQYVNKYTRYVSTPFCFRQPLILGQRVLGSILHDRAQEDLPCRA